MADSLHDRGDRLPRLLPLLLLALIALPSCVSGARHQAALREAERLRRENEQLRRSVAEYRVRVEEALEALERERREGSSTAPAPAAPSPAPQAPRREVPDVEERSGGPILEEDLRTQVTPERAEAEALGEEGVLRVARRYREMGRRREAIDAYTRLIRDFPFSGFLPEAFLSRGRLRQADGDRAGALSDYETVAEAFPYSPEAPEARRLAAILRDR